MKIISLLCLLLFTQIFYADTVGASRTKCLPGDRIVVWSRNQKFNSNPDGSLPNAQMVNSRGKTASATRSGVSPYYTWLDKITYTQVIVPPIGPGRYNLIINNESVPLEVVEDTRTEKYLTFGPSDPQQSVQQAIGQGYNIILNPGLYVWNSPLYLRPYCMVKSANAVIESNGDFIFGSAEGATVDGVILRSKTTNTKVFSPFTNALNMNLRNCKMYNTAITYPGDGLYVEDCEFHGGGIFCGPGLYTGTKFYDSKVHAFNVSWANNNLAMVDCLFDRTDRGPIFNCLNNDIRGCLFANIRIMNLNLVDNGAESFLCEPFAEVNKFGFYDNMVLHVRIHNSGYCIQLDSRASNNLFYDFWVDGGSGAVFWGENTNNVLDTFEFRNGASIIFGPKATNNSFNNGAFVNWFPNRGNQFWYKSEWYDIKSPVYDVDPTKPSSGNRFSNISFAINQLHYTPFSANVIMNNCKVNGKDMIQK